MEILSKMLEAMVVTLREGVEAALVVGILLSYIRKTGRSHLRRYVYHGLWVAFLLSLAAAIVVQRLGLDLENELVEGTLMLIAAALVGSLLIWMWRGGRNLGQGDGSPTGCRYCQRVRSWAFPFHRYHGSPRRGRDGPFPFCPFGHHRGQSDVQHRGGSARPPASVCFRFFSDSREP